MIVTCYKLDTTTAQPRMVGTISMQKDGTLKAVPATEADTILMEHTLGDEIWIDQGSEPPLKLNAIHHPKEFLEGLVKQYANSSYFWCVATED